MVIELTISGKPPIKHGEQSMWGRDDQAARIVALRERASEAFERAGIRDVIRSHISLELTLYLPRMELERGDLDNFITGVCDGLQAVNANPNTKIHSEFLKPGREAIHPRRAFIQNDSQIMSIMAKKVLLDNNAEPYYTVVLGA